MANVEIDGVNSKVYTDQVDPKTATTLTLGTSGDTVSIPSGVTIANAGTATGFGESNTPAFLAAVSSALSIADSTVTTVVFNSEKYDSASGYDTSNGRWTPGVAGKYQLSTSLRSYSFTCNNFRAEFQVNGVTLAGAYSKVNTSGDSINVSVIATLDADDYVTVAMYQDSGGTVSTDYSGSTLQTFFQGFRLIT